MKTIEVLRRVEGTAGARRVGTDAMSPTFAQLLPVAFPAAELVDGEVAMRAARRIKTEEELAVLREAVAVAETSLAKAVAELRPGATAKELAGVLLEAAAAGGVDHPRGPGRGRRHQPGTPLAAGGRRWPGRRRRPGRLHRGSRRARLHRRGRADLCRGRRRVPEALAARCDRVWKRLLAACRPGAPASDLLEGYAGRASRCRRCRSPEGSASASTRRW